jgi:hypothetical protein
MRHLFVLFGIGMLLPLGGCGHSLVAGAWCASLDVAPRQCGFYTLEQCRQFIRGAGGLCEPNPYTMATAKREPLPRSRRWRSR